MPTITIPKSQALDILDSGEYIKNDLASQERWTITYRLIFELNGKLYETFYRVGATEYQDESPWQYDNDVKCAEVKEITVIDYEVI